MTTVNMISKNGKHYITLKDETRIVQTITTGSYWRALFLLYFALKGLRKGGKK